MNSFLINTKSEIPSVSSPINQKNSNCSSSFLKSQSSFSPLILKKSSFDVSDEAINDKSFGEFLKNQFESVSNIFETKREDFIESKELAVLNTCESRFENDLNLQNIVPRLISIQFKTKSFK